MPSSRPARAYTPDAFAYALPAAPRKASRKTGADAALPSGPHFVPKLATALQTTAISDVIGFRSGSRQAAFTRQMFQGNFVAE